VEEALSSLRESGIGAKVDHMFALPGEPTAAQKTARLVYVEHKPFRIQTFWTNFFPGTEMLDQARTMGLLTDNDVENIKEGIAVDFYRDSNRIADKRVLKTYKIYEMIFKLIPLLPKPLARRLKPQNLKFLPTGLCSAIGFLADITNGLARRNPDHVSYARHYLCHLGRFVKLRLGLKVKPMTTVRRDNGNL
jgi:hypothetical protein